MKILLIIANYADILIWIFFIAAVKVAKQNSIKKQTKSEMIADVAMTLFGGMLAAITIKEMNVKAFKWLIISGCALTGGEILKKLSINTIDFADYLGKYFSKKYKK